MTYRSQRTYNLASFGIGLATRGLGLSSASLLRIKYGEDNYTSYLHHIF